MVDEKTKAELINQKVNDSLMQGDASMPSPREATDPDEIAKLRADRLPRLIKYANDLVRLMKLPRPEYKSERNQLKRDRTTAWQNLEDELEYYEHPRRPYTLADYVSYNPISKSLLSHVLDNTLSVGNSLLEVMEEEEDKKEGPELEH